MHIDKCMDIETLLYQFQRKWWPPCSPPAMFNLMTNCCSWVSKIQEPIRKVSVLVVGLDKAGKTSCIRGMLRVPHAMEAGPTFGCVRTELRVENYLVTLLDIGGAPESRGAWREHCGEVHGIIFVVDSSDRQRMKEAKELMSDLLKQPRVAGKPILVLANKQDKMNALLGSELIEILSLEKLVNQSRSLCHIEPCSALMDLRRWSDSRSLRGLRWLLRAVCLDFPELCSRVAMDSRRPRAADEREKHGKTEKARRKPKEERLSSKSELRLVDQPQEKEKKTKARGKMQPIRNMLQKESTLKTKLKRKKKKKVKIKETEKDKEGETEQEEEEVEGNEGEQEQPGLKERASSALIRLKRRKLRRKPKVKEETPHVSETPDNEEKAPKAKGEKRKKKKLVKVKRKNKINTEEVPGPYSEPVDLSATFDLYRKAILALRERQDSGPE